MGRPKGGTYQANTYTTHPNSLNRDHNVRKGASVSLAKILREYLEDNDSEKLRAMIATGVQKAIDGDHRWFEAIMHRAYGRVPISIDGAESVLNVVIAQAVPDALPTIPELGKESGGNQSDIITDADTVH